MVALENTNSFSTFQPKAEKAVVLVDVERAENSLFSDFEVHHVQLDNLTFCEVSCDPVVVKRENRHISKDGIDDLLLMFQLAGEALFTINNKNYFVKQGDLAIVEAGQPYNIIYQKSCRRLFLRMSKQILSNLCIEKKVSWPMFRNLQASPMGRILLCFMMSIVANSKDLQQTDGHSISTCIQNLLETVLRSDDSNKLFIDQSESVSMTDQIFDYLEINFRNSDIKPQRIAKEFSISVRYLHSLVSATGTTLSKWLWERRLLASYEALQNHRFQGKKIIEVAFDFGFSDAAHFSRAFKTRFGLTPSEARRKAR